MSSDTNKINYVLTQVLLAIVPVLLALFVGALIILGLGSDPVIFYSKVVEYGLGKENWIRTLTLMAPLAIIAVGLIVSFRGQLWNLGASGQYLVGAVVASGLGPIFLTTMNALTAYFLIFVIALFFGALTNLIPAYLKAKFGTNEIITSLVMSFISIGAVNLMIKGPFKDPSYPVPQTRQIPLDSFISYIPGTKIHISFIVAILIAIVAQYIFSMTSTGLKLDVFGASVKTAKHIGLNSKWMVFILFLLSGAIVSFAGAIDILGNWGYQRANWDPNYGLAIIPFVFLARLSPLGSIPFVFFYATFVTGGTLAAQQANLNVDFLLVIVGLILVFMTLTEFLNKRISHKKALKRRLTETLATENKSDVLNVTPNEKVAK